MTTIRNLITYKNFSKNKNSVYSQNSRLSFFDNFRGILLNDKNEILYTYHTHRLVTTTCITANLANLSCARMIN